MPRSLAHCYNWIDDTVEDLGEFYGANQPSLEMGSRIWKDLKSTDMDAIYNNGLHEFLTDFIGRNNAFAHQLSIDYNFA